MKEKFKSSLKRWPKIYNVLKKNYSLLRVTRNKLEMRLLGTKVKEKFWVRRHLQKGDDWGDKNNNWIRGYWNSRSHSHRSLLIERISKLNPSSILEIGCNCGPNLYLLARKFPDAEIVGVDINSMAVDEGNKWFAEEGITNVKLLVKRADDLSSFSDKSFDIVFTDATLIYVGPDKIMKVMKEMLRIARKTIFLLEWHYFESGGADRRGLGVYHSGAWKRDYVALLKQFVEEKRIAVTRITGDIWPEKNWAEVGAIIEVTMY